MLDVNDEEFEEHSPIETTLGKPRAQSGRAVEVDLRSSALTDIGVLEPVLRRARHRRSSNGVLEFNVRSAATTDAH
jgi:hypothetical protein